ncbi:hypothetical protein LCGC14_1109360 [marine sediment metagenome]|uniref:Uncharacterized protein n=1 Tax=marine sediment metagenome TaxID=412755 RepID=A0A0F9M7C2_9ZZZZ
MSESLQDVLNEARDDIKVATVHKRLIRAGLLLQYNTVRAWFREGAEPGIKHAAALFDALNMDDDQRARAVKAAAR